MLLGVGTNPNFLSAVIPFYTYRSCMSYLANAGDTQSKILYKKLASNFDASSC